MLNIQGIGSFLRRSCSAISIGITWAIVIYTTVTMIVWAASLVGTWINLFAALLYLLPLNIVIGIIAGLLSTWLWVNPSRWRILVFVVAGIFGEIFIPALLEDEIRYEIWDQSTITFRLSIWLLYAILTQILLMVVIRLMMISNKVILQLIRKDS